MNTPLPRPMQSASSEEMPMAAPAAHSTPWWQRLLQGLLIRSSEPRIRTYGHLHRQIWRVYDPISEKTLWLSSEDQVRQWLERRYYP